MGQGQDKIANSLLDMQPTAVLEFFRIYPDVTAKPDVFIPIHNGSNFGNNVTWQGVQYISMPIEGEGFEINGNGQLNRPKIRIANKNNLITSLLQNNYDFKNAKIVRKRTFLKYLDDINFDGGNPFGSQDYTAEISNQSYLVSQKTAENKVYVEFEVTSPLDLENFEITHRQILAKYCYWLYRGNGCNYAGIPIEKEDGTDFVGVNSVKVNVIQPVAGFMTDTTKIWNSTTSYAKGSIVYLENPKIYINQNPNNANSYYGFMKIWYVSIIDANINQNPQSNPLAWAKDGCSKKLPACKKRFISNLPFGGYPGTDGFGYGG